MSCEVSVILPVYNGEKYIRQSLDSLLNQTFCDFEIVIIDDCSTDLTASIIQEYSDSRIRYYRNVENRGIVHSLNRAILLSCGKYIARMDADDVCLPNRLEKQVAYLDQHPQVGLLSTWFEMFGELEGPIRYETNPERIKCKLLFSLQLLHPGWMFRRRLVEENGLSYREEYNYSEDWDFLVRASAVTQMSNIPEILMRYRINPGQITKIFNQTSRQVADRVARNQLSELSIYLSDDDFRLYRDSFGRREKFLSTDDMRQLICILRQLENANKTKNIYSSEVLHTIIQEELFYLCYYNLTHNHPSGLQLFSSGYYRGLRISAINHCKLLLRTIWVFFHGSKCIP